MPVYSAACPTCGLEADYFASVAERNDHVPKCCGQTMKRVISAVFVSDDITPYVSPTTGRVVGSRSDRRDDMKRSRSRPWEGFEQERKEAQRQRAYADKKEDTRLTEAAHRAWHELSPSKRAVLDGSD